METAEDRRARLKALRDAAGTVETLAEPATDPEPEKKSKRPRGAPKASSDAAEPVLKFRNYNVRDEKISHTVLEPAKPPEFKEPAIAADVHHRPEDLIARMAETKPNQDLRRDIEKSLAKLERRTQRALVQIAQSQAIESEA